MANYRAPGVYIEEISQLLPSVAPVATAVPAFIGYTEKKEKKGQLIADYTPVKVSSLIEYIEIFGAAFNEKLTVTLTGRGTTEKETRITISPSTQLSPYSLSNNLEMYFGNGGGPCYIVSVGTYTTLPIPTNPSSLIEFTRLREGIKATEKVDEVTLLAVPEAIVLNKANRKSINDEMLAQCNKLMDRFSILDVPVLGGTVNNDINEFRADVGFNFLKFGAAYYPSLKTTLKFAFDFGEVIVVDNRPGAIYNNTTLSEINGNIISKRKLRTDRVLCNNIVKLISKTFEVALYPSATIASVYVKMDSERGVWKAPANVSLQLIKAPSVIVTNEQQEHMNVDVTSGKSINALRVFPNKGIVVWGARTLAGNNNEWRYVPVRRFFNFVEESLKKSTEFVVFEPNDANTWIKTKAMIENFLSKLWRDRALAGATPDKAFFVKIGLGETMTSADILKGRMIIEIGMAVVRPAEFIILKFTHKLQAP